MWKPDQFRCARALLGLSTRELGGLLDCSAMAISKIEGGSIKNGRLVMKMMEFYEQQKGLTAYAGGVINADAWAIRDYANPIRERLLNDGSGSAYVRAFDAIVELAAGTQKSETSRGLDEKAGTDSPES